VLLQIDQCLNDMKLTRSKTKTHVHDSNSLEFDPVQYLGLMFDGKRIFIRSSSIHKYHRKVKKGVQAAVIRQKEEAEKSGTKAPLRRQALYNMYSEMPVRGKKIKERKTSQKYNGNFISYLDRVATVTGSATIPIQRRRLLKKLISRVKPA